MVLSRRHLLAGASLVTGSGLLLSPRRAMAQAKPGESKAPEPPAKVDVAELMKPGPLPDQAIGDANAPVTIVEYASMTCSHCAHFHTETYPELKKRYVETGKVRYILREFPFDPVAAGASMLSRCAGEDKSLALAEELFKTQKDWAFVQNAAAGLFAIVSKHGFDKVKFEGCLRDQKLLDAINAIRERGMNAFGVNSTPTFFINGERAVGSMSIQELAAKIDPLLPK